MTTTYPPPVAAPIPAIASTPFRRWHERVLRPAGQPAWARPALLGLLAATALLYLWTLGDSGWANSFYSAAAQAGSQSWKAFFFGSSDAGNSITVDKTPASLWAMALSVRLFGLSSWSILVPQALMGVATVGLLYTTVRRWFGAGAGLLAGAVTALTPVAVLMFRFNNPDALLVLLLVAGAYTTVRAIETGRTRWLLLVGTMVGFGFLTKMLQAVLVVPAFAVAYLVAGPTSIGRRIRQLLLGGVAMLVSAGWWVAIVSLIPAADRPYIGGSQNNSVLELALGYNGFGRLTGNEVGSVGGGGPGNGAGGFWGQTGLTRLFDAENGGQISWLMPAALILLVAGLVLTARRPRTDRTRAALLLWGGWFLVTAITFSLMAGIFHPYYSVALAPAVGALIGVGALELWRRRDTASRVTLAAVVAVSAAWSATLLARSPDFASWLRPLVLVVGIAAALALLVTYRLPRLAAAGIAAVAVAASLGGSAAYAVQTATTGHSGAIPSAGPAATTGFGQGGPFGGPGSVRGFGGRPGGFGGFGGGLPGTTGGGSLPGGGPQNNSSSPGNTLPGNGFAPGNGPGGFGPGGIGGAGGLLDAGTPSSEVIALLQANADRYTWVAAAIGSNSAAGFQLASSHSVMPIGGFNGSDPSPTLTQFQQYVHNGQIHYFIGSGGFRANGGSQASQQISQWVEENFTATTVGGITLYDLTQPAAG
jgi:4-amino-4-deoxy-L-arabinose transferase-like glycosyltransferase